MCVLALDFRPQAVAGYRLRLISNRDEFFSRPTQSAHWWRVPGTPAWVLGGRDLRAGGSWLAISRAGRLAVLTNHRRGLPAGGQERSRGELVERWVGQSQAGEPAEALAETIAAQAYRYAGFNLLLFDCPPEQPARGWSLTNRGEAGAQPLAAGIHGLSNDVLNTPWPKTEALRQAVARHRDTGLSQFRRAALAALREEQTAPDEALPSTGIDLARERALSAVFILPPQPWDESAYGTRCSSVLDIGPRQASFFEQTWHHEAAQRHFVFDLQALQF